MFSRTEMTKKKNKAEVERIWKNRTDKCHGSFLAASGYGTVVKAGVLYPLNNQVKVGWGGGGFPLGVFPGPLMELSMTWCGWYSQK